MTNKQFKDLTNYGEISWDDLAYIVVPAQFNSDHAGTWINYRISVQDLLADCGRTYVNAADPTTLDDVDAGYKVGDEWVNSTSSAVFKCADASVGAAVWNQMPTSGLPATTASNDFVVGNGSSWLKKTLAEVKTILGLGSLAYKSTIATADIDADAVTLAKLVNASAQYKLLGRASAAAGDWEEISSSANVFTFLGAADYAAMRTQLSLVVGTNVQAYDADLTTWAGLTPSAFFQTLVDDASASAARTTLGVTNEFNIEVVIGDGTNAITASTPIPDIEVPCAATIVGWTIVADASGSIVVDVWKDTYANYPPTVADTIAGTEKPTLSSVQKNQDLTLSSWTTSLAKGDWLKFKVDSATTVKWAVLSIRCTTTGA